MLGKTFSLILEKKFSVKTRKKNINYIFIISSNRVRFELTNHKNLFFINFDVF